MSIQPLYLQFLEETKKEEPKEKPVKVDLVEKKEEPKKKRIYKRRPKAVKVQTKRQKRIKYSKKSNIDSDSENDDHTPEINIDELLQPDESGRISNMKKKEAVSDGEDDDE